MTTSQDAIRRLSIQATTNGVAEATAQLGKLAGAQDNVAVASTNTEKATLALDSRFASIERRLVSGVRAQQDYDKIQRQVNAAVAQNPALQERANAVLAAAEAKFNALTKAVNDNASALARQAAEAARAASVQGNVNTITGVSDGSNSAARAADVAAYGKALDDLRGKYNPLFAAGQTYKTTLAEINQAVKVGAITEAERAAAVMDTKVAFVQQVNSLRGVRDAQDITSASTGKFATGVGLARHELINLSRQAQDVVVSLAGGQGLGTVLLQQGSQVTDVFASSTATLGGFFKQVTGWLSNFLTFGRVAFGGVAAAVGVAVMALNSYLSAQHGVQLALTGAGRASGVTGGDINAAARGGSSTFGLSVSEARDLATALAATGKVGAASLLPIVQLGKDFATTFGVEAKEATEKLAQAFADPVKGAEDLNTRLGFLDAATQRQLASLAEQNRTYDAQKLLLAGLQSSLAKTSEVTSLWSQAWLGLKNTAGTVFDFVGEKIANVLHLNDSLPEQAARIQEAIKGYESPMGKLFGSTADLEALKKQLADINALIEKRAVATRDAAAAADSLRVQNAVFSQLPEIQQRQSAANQASVAGRVSEDPLLQQSLGITQAQANRARDITKQLSDGFKTSAESIQTSAKIALDSVTAFSPQARALIAARQATERYRAQGGIDPAEKAKIAQDAYNLSLKQSQVALSEASRQRELTANQSIASAQLEIDMIGKTIGQQTELRANLAARQQLEQEASQNRTAFDNAEYARLQKINAELGKRAQAAAQASVNDNISFGRQTSLLSPDDVQIAQQLRTIYPDVATALSSVEAAGLRTNSALSTLSSSISSSLVTGLTDIVDGTKSVGQGFADLSKVVIRSIEEMIIKITIVTPLMRSLQAAAGMFGGMFGGGGGAAATSGLDGLAAIHHAGGIVGAESTVARNVHPAIFNNAPRFHNGLMPDEFPAILQKGEGVFTKGQMAALGGGSSAPNIIINNNSGGPVKTSTAPNGDVTITIEKMVDEAVGKSMSSGTGMRVLNKQYGVTQFAGQ